MRKRLRQALVALSLGVVMVAGLTAAVTSVWPASKVSVTSFLVTNLEDAFTELFFYMNLSTGERQLYEILSLEEIPTLTGFTPKYFNPGGAGGDWGAGSDSNECLTKLLPCETTTKIETECTIDVDCIIKDASTYTGTDLGDGLDLAPTAPESELIRLMLSGETPVADGGTLPVFDCTGRGWVGDETVLSITPDGAPDPSSYVVIQNLVFQCDTQNDTISPDDESKVLFLNVAGTQEFGTGGTPSTNSALELPGPAGGELFQVVSLNSTFSADNYHAIRYRSDGKFVAIGAETWDVDDDQYIDNVAVFASDPTGAQVSEGQVTLIGHTFQHTDSAVGSGDKTRAGVFLDHAIATGFTFEAAFLTVDGVDTTDGLAAAYGIYTNRAVDTGDYTITLWDYVAKNVFANSAANYAAALRLIGGVDATPGTTTLEIKGFTTDNIYNSNGAERSIYITDCNEVADPICAGNLDYIYFDPPDTGTLKTVRVTTGIDDNSIDVGTCADIVDDSAGLEFVTSITMGGHCGNLPAPELSWLIGGNGSNNIDPSPGNVAGGEFQEEFTVTLATPIPAGTPLNDGAAITALTFTGFADARRIINEFR